MLFDLSAWYVLYGSPVTNYKLFVAQEVVKQEEEMNATVISYLITREHMLFII